MPRPATYDGWPEGECDVRPVRAPVAPRVRVGPDGVPLRLEHCVRRLLAAGASGAIHLHGPPGSGKTVALAHLAAVLAPDARVRFAAGEALDVEAGPGTRLLVNASHPAPAGHCPHCLACFTMAPWTADDLIEYLLAVHPHRCASVMKRVQASSVAAELCGLPAVWRPVLDELAASDALPDAVTALRSCLAGPLSDPKQHAASACLALLKEGASADQGEATAGLDDEQLGLDPRVLRLIRYRPVQVLLAGERIVSALCDGAGCRGLLGRLPHDLIDEVARRVRHWPEAMRSLEAVTGDAAATRLHASAAGILLAADPAWRLKPGYVPHLGGARLGGAKWPGVGLRGADLSEADLCRADLDGGLLDQAVALKASFRAASLRQASMKRISAAEADFGGADLRRADATGARLQGTHFARAKLDAASLSNSHLRRADLTGACLAGATLTHAVLEDTKVEGADLRGADFAHADLTRVALCDAYLAGASFREARLGECNLEGADFPAADFRGACAAGCLFTGSAMPHADFRGADLRNTGLADIDWPGADLRGADLRGCTFHLGTTRSGLVGSTVPCEGSRTGFYTDDYDAHAYRPPEEVRKANLCHADLRGAHIDGVDFYLVDLRGAIYTADQREHFERCRAILGETD